MRLREDLREYVYAHLQRAHEDGTPLLRPMVFEFPDPSCVNATDQFMFGDSWLVAPVLSKGSVSQQVYLPALPAGQHWQHYYTNTTSTSPGWHTVATPTVDTFPLFYRSFGSGTTGPAQASASEEAYGGFDFRGWRPGHHPDPRARTAALLAQ